ncbi:phosphotransferase [Actinopolymorpha pittospori]
MTQRERMRHLRSPGLPDERLVADATNAFGLGSPLRLEPLTTGFMNRSWQATTSAGTFAVKQTLDHSPEQARRQHAVLDALAARGFPAPIPLALPDGDTLLDHACGSFTLTPWMPGVLREGVDLAPAECTAAGHLLGELHHHLAAVLPPEPDTAVSHHREPATDPRAALEAIDHYASLIEARPVPDEFDEQARRMLRTRHEHITAQAHLRPLGSTWLGPYGWMHGDFQQFNLLWEHGRISAVLDWDRLCFGSLLGEVVRAAVFLFMNRERGNVDLDRVSAFIAGYRATRPVTEAQLVDAVHRWWWDYLCGLWPLDWHYDHGDTSCDQFFLAASALLSWWYDHHDAAIESFTRP